MATQEDTRMTNWLDYFKNAIQPPKLPQKPAYTQNSPTNDFGYTLGQALGTALFGERVPKAGENAGINTDLSQAQSNAHMQNLINSTVDPNSTLGQAMQQYGTGFEPKQTWAQQHDINQIANSMGNQAWNNAGAIQAANNQFNFNPTDYLNDNYKKQGIGQGWKRW